MAFYRCFNGGGYVKRNCTLDESQPHEFNVKSNTGDFVTKYNEF